jgi:hypothetical protein
MIRVRTSDGMHKIKIPSDLISVKELKETIAAQTNIPVDLQVLSRDIAGQEIIGPENMSLKSLNIRSADIIYLAGRLEKKVTPKSYVNQDGEVVSAGIQFIPNTNNPSVQAAKEEQTQPAVRSLPMADNAVRQPASNVVDLTNEVDEQPSQPKPNISTSTSTSSQYQPYEKDKSGLSNMMGDEDYIRPADPVRSMRLYDDDEPHRSNQYEPRAAATAMSTTFQPPQNPFADIDQDALLAAKLAGLSDEDVLFAHFLGHADMDNISADANFTQDVKKRSHSNTRTTAQPNIHRHTATSKAREEFGSQRGPMRAMLDPPPPLDRSPATKKPTPPRQAADNEQLDPLALGLSAEDIAEQIKMLDMYEDRHLPMDQYKEFIEGQQSQPQPAATKAAITNPILPFHYTEDSLDDIVAASEAEQQQLYGNVNSHIDPDVALAISRSLDDQKKQSTPIRKAATHRSSSLSSSTATSSSSATSTSIPIRRVAAIPTTTASTESSRKTSTAYPSHPHTPPRSNYRSSQPSTHSVAGASSLRRVPSSPKVKIGADTDNHRQHSREDMIRRKKLEKERAEALLREKQMKEDEELARRLQRDSNEDGIFVAPLAAADEDDRDLDEMMHSVAALNQDSFIQSRQPHRRSYEDPTSDHRLESYQDEDWLLAKALSDSLLNS